VTVNGIKGRDVNDTVKVEIKMRPKLPAFSARRNRDRTSKDLQTLYNTVHKNYKYDFNIFSNYKLGNPL